MPGPHAPSIWVNKDTQLQAGLLSTISLFIRIQAAARVGSVLDFNVGLNLEAEEKRDMDILAIQESLQQKIGRHAQDDGRGDATGAGGIANLSLEQGLDSSMLSTSIATRLVQHV